MLRWYNMDSFSFKKGVFMITKDMTFQDVVRKYPQTIQVFVKYGLGCIGCHAAQFENVEQGAMVHGINVDQLIKELNEAAGLTSK